MIVDAVVLAGGKNTVALREASGVDYEAIIPINSKPMVRYVLDALQKVESLGRIVVVGPEKEIKNCLEGDNIDVISAGNTVVENAELGLAALSQSERVLLITCDVPLITPQAVENFLTLCGDLKADLYYPVVPRNMVDAKYPGTKRTYVRLRDGEFTGGNLFLINPAVLSVCMARGEQLVAARKSPLRLARMVGITFLIKFLLRLLTLREAESRVSRLFGINGVVITSAFPEIGVDVDKVSDLELVRKKLTAGE